MKRIAAILAAAALTGAAHANTVTSDIIGAKGDKIGTLTVADAPTGVMLTIEIGPGGLTPGWHGNHLHAVGDCSDVGTFKKSTGHINPSGKKHGLMNPDGPDNADLPNIYVHADGSAHAQIFSSRVSLKGAVALLDADGSALVIHANPDDHMTQPIGGAGGRVACAALK